MKHRDFLITMNDNDHVAVVSASNKKDLITAIRAAIADHVNEYIRDIALEVSFHDSDLDELGIYDWIAFDSTYGNKRRGSFRISKTWIYTAQDYNYKAGMLK